MRKEKETNDGSKRNGKIVTLPVQSNVVRVELDGVSATGGGEGGGERERERVRERVREREHIC